GTTEAFARIKQTLKTAVMALISYFEDFKAAIKGNLTEIDDYSTNIKILATVFEVMKSSVIQAADSIKLLFSVLGTLVEQAKVAAHTIYLVMTGEFKKAWETAKNKTVASITDMKNSFVTFGKSVAQNVIT